MFDNELQGRRVLIVEDEMMVVMLVETILEECGCTVIPANSVNAALALIEAGRFDAAILDVNLDGADSYAVADALAARDVPFIFSTGYGARGMRPGYERRPVVPKPYRPEELIEVLAAAMENRPSL